jgi:predicted metal-dependent phosphoesterase TrpH
MKIDMHVHTYISPDALTTPREMKKVLMSGKVDYVCLTDHERVKSWEEFKHLNVIQGVERTIIEENGNKFHLLCYFLNEKIKSQNFDEVIDEVREQDGFCSIAHPFDARCKPSNVDLYYEKVDALECFNSRIRVKNGNEMALNYAKLHGLGRTAGSDAHHHSEIGNAYVECDCTDLEEFRKKLKKNEISVCGKSFLYPWVRIYSIARRVRILKPKF